MQNLDVYRVKRILLIQAITAVFVIGVIFLLFREAIVSASMGALAALTGNAISAAWIFGRYKAQDPGGLVFRFYGAELMKLLVIILVFAVTIIWIKPLSPIALFGAFFVVQVLPSLLAHRFSD